MRLRVIAHLVTHAGSQYEPSPVFQFSDELTRQAQQHMAFRTPMIGDIARAVLDEAHADFAESLRAPQSCTVFACVRCLFDGIPLGDFEG